MDFKEPHLRVMFYTAEPMLRPRIFHIFAYAALQGGLVLWYFPGSLTRRNI